MRKTFAAVILVAAVFSLSACESTAAIPTPKPVDVVGTWTHGSSVLKLDVDGSFTLADIPTGVVKQTYVKPHHGPRGPNVSVEGNWVIGSGGNDAGGAPAVQLNFTRRIGAYSGLTLLVDDTIPSSTTDEQLYVNLGNPDSHIEYSYKKK
jgi:hypothetical protein